jgi:hypothetical protein
MTTTAQRTGSHGGHGVAQPPGPAPGTALTGSAVLLVLALVAVLTLSVPSQAARNERTD